MDYENTFTQLDLLRHGELATPGLFCADADEPLSKVGMKNIISATEKGNWDVIISSPYHRCRAFAERLAERRHCELRLDDHFREMDFGEWTGMKAKDLWDQEPERLQQLWESPHTFVAPEGEAILGFCARVNEGLQLILEENPHRSILLVTHAGVIRCVLAEALGISPLSALKFSIKHAHFSCLRYYPDKQYALYAHGVRNIA